MPRRTIGWSQDAAAVPHRARSWYLKEHDQFKFFIRALVIKARRKFENLPSEGSSLFGLFQLRVIVFPVIASITGGPSGGSGTISVFQPRKSEKSSLLSTAALNSEVAFTPASASASSDHF